MLINDRIDIALAIDADGVHLGQTDMPISIARKLLPPGKIIGTSCNNKEHAKKAVEDGVDYIGIGAVWSTQTKKLTNPVVGVRGVGEILDCLEGTQVKAVGIGMFPVSREQDVFLFLESRRNKFQEHLAYTPRNRVVLRAISGRCRGSQ